METGGLSPTRSGSNPRAKFRNSNREASCSERVAKPVERSGARRKTVVVESNQHVEGTHQITDNACFIAERTAVLSEGDKTGRHQPGNGFGRDLCSGNVRRG